MKKRPLQLNSILLSILVLLFAHQVSAADADKEFPGRDTYPEVKFIELNDFHDKLKKKEIRFKAHISMFFADYDHFSL